MIYSARSFLFATVLVTGCAAAAPEAQAPRPTSAPIEEVKLTAPDGAARPYREIVAASPWTVFVFVSSSCPCLDSHKDRLVELEAAYGARGVQFLGVDPEVGTTKEIAAQTGRELGLTFPILVDPGAKLADALRAQYATYSVVVDRAGNVVYRGGIDTDKRKLHADATPYLRDVLDDLLAGVTPRHKEGKALGCMLRKW